MMIISILTGEIPSTSLPTHCVSASVTATGALTDHPIPGDMIPSCMTGIIPIHTTARITARITLTGAGIPPMGTTDTTITRGIRGTAMPPTIITAPITLQKPAAAADTAQWQEDLIHPPIPGANPVMPLPET